MRLASPELVVTAASIPSNDGSIARAAGALNSSFYLLESILETKLAQVTMLDAYTIPAQTTAPYILRLTNRFIDTATVLVYCKPAGSPLTDLTIDYQLLTGEFTVDAAKGLVTIFERLPYYGDSCISVIATSGFPEDPNDANLLIAPEDIQQLAVNAALLELNTLPSTVANRKDKANASVTKGMYGYLAKACEPYSRPRMTVEYPSASMVYV